jgi:hypothetical protein
MEIGDMGILKSAKKRQKAPFVMTGGEGAD